MANVNLPSMNLLLSGPVTQTFFPWTNYFTVNVGQSSDDNVEKDVLADVASYGKQLGRFGDALVVLLRYVALPPDGLSEEERRALCDLMEMLHKIADVKVRHHASLVLRPSQPKQRPDVNALSPLVTTPRRLSPPASAPRAAFWSSLRLNPESAHAPGLRLRCRRVSGLVR